MLVQQKIISKEEAILILKALLKLWRNGPDIIEITPGRADLYSNLEDWLVKEIGIDVGGKFHIGRSRNDMETTLSRMFCRAYLIDFVLAVCDLTKVLLDKADSHVNTVMPGYTHHSQHAQPTTMGHYLLWGVDNFLRDIDRSKKCYVSINFSPMGAAALCTTGFPVDRKYVAELLGFDGVVEHSIDASGSRDFMLEMGSVLSIFQSNLNRMTELLLVWNIREIGMIKIARKHCSYSSIMPQKINPVSIEMLRNNATVSYGRLNAMFINLKGTTPGNGREPILLDESLADIIKVTIPSASYFGDIINEMAVDPERCLQLAREGFSTMTELADEMVRNKGISFYMAHKVVSRLALLAVQNNIPCEKITGEMIANVSEELFNNPIEMSQAEINKALNPIENVKHRSVMGGPAYQETGRMIEDRRKQVADISEKWGNEKKRQIRAIQKVKNNAIEMIDS